jgi:hypothetical protein
MRWVNPSIDGAAAFTSAPVWRTTRVRIGSSCESDVAPVEGRRGPGVPQLDTRVVMTARGWFPKRGDTHNMVKTPRKRPSAIGKKRHHRTRQRKIAARRRRVR